MFGTTSRYYSLENATLTTMNGRTITYKRRRIIPKADEMQLLVEVTVNQGDRLDLITSRTLGDPEQFWRICDANNEINPVVLTSDPGRIIRIPVPQF